MSVQLIVYPQDLLATTNTTTTTTASGQEFINDGQNFSTLNSATSAEGVSDYSVHGNGLHALDINPPITPHEWYRYRNVSAAFAPDYQDYPTQINNNCVFETLGTLAAPNQNNWSAIYQRMTGLVVGQDYLIRITNNCLIPEESVDVVEVIYDSPGFNPYYALPTIHPPVATGYNFRECTITPYVIHPCVLNGVDILYEFTATETEHIFYLAMDAQLNTLTEATITSISVMSLGAVSTVTTTGFSTDLAGQEICDLYEDETIPLTLSVDDFKDVASKTQSYSKAFNLPATKKNNKIFGSIYEITKKAETYYFNPYARTPIILKENGFIIFEGFLRLLDIVEKDGEISYNVNLYSETVALMDAMKGKTFYELPLCELDHTYDIESIVASETGVLPLTNQLQAGSFAGANGSTTTDVLKYPLVDWTGTIHRSATTVQIDLGATDGNPAMDKLEDCFRPFIKLKYLVDNIFAGSGFSYTSAFFDSTYFSNLFMDFNWGEARDGSAPNRNDFCNRKSDNTAAKTYLYQSPSWRNCPVSIADSPGGSTDLWHNSNYKFISDVNNLVVTGKYRNQVSNRPWAAPWWNVDTWTVRLRICVFDSNDSVLEVIDYEEWKDPGICVGCSRAIEGTYEVVLNNGDYIQMEGQVLDSDATSDVYFSDTTHSYLWMTYNNNAVGVCSLLQAARGELGQWDFFKGLTTMFNLITLQDPQDPQNLLVEPYNDIFTEDVETLDWTKKVDVSDIKLKPVDLERSIVFQFEEDEEDYPFMAYKAAAAGLLYGSRKYEPPGFDLFQGEKEIIASPFAATIFKPLFDDISDFYAPVIYGANDEQTEFGSIKNLPRILYDTGSHTTNDSFYIPAQNGGADNNATSYRLFSHTNEVIPASASGNDLSFWDGYQLFVGVAPLQNLFSYYANYLDELYNADVKSMNIKVWLTPEDIANFNFYNKIFIKNREYRVDKINYKPNDLSTVEFILIT